VSQRRRTSRHICFSMLCRKSCCGPMTEPGRQKRSQAMTSAVVSSKCFIK